MCGIVGIYCKQGHVPKDLTEGFLQKSLEEMRRRGPDGNKQMIVDDFYATGFARLAIRDLSENGMQPMRSDCGEYTISFNGEIYNTDLLKKNLEIYSVNYKSTSDTEVVLYHFKYFGFEETIKLLDGIFAIALYNSTTKELYLSRDRAGVKPLYIYNDDDFLIYSSHYNQVVRNDFVTNRAISLDGLSSYFNLGYVPSGYGFFENSFLLPQGAYIKVKGSKPINTELFFRYNETNSEENKPLSTVIKKAVGEQLVSDVPLGTFLSGGIDSSIVTMYANEEQSVNAYNIGFSNKEFDESNVAERFAQQKNVNFKTKIFDHVDYIALIKENIEAYNEPFSDFSSLPTLLLSKFTKEKVTVVLSGDGGDELFYGYPRNLKYGLSAGLLTSSYFKKVLRIGKSKITKEPLRLSAREILANPNESLIKSNYISSAKNIGKNIVPEMVGDIYLDFLDNKETKINNKNAFFNYIRVYEYYYHLQRILIKVDRASMYHSLEARVPLLSNAVIDASQSYTFEDCTSQDKGKIPLREIIKSEVDGDLFNLPKKGFTLPLYDIINNDKTGIFRNYILMSIPEIDKYLDSDYIESLYNNHIKRVKNYIDTTWVLWSIFSLKAWYHNHIQN